MTTLPALVSPSTLSQPLSQFRNLAHLPNFLRCKGVPAALLHQKRKIRVEEHPSLLREIHRRALLAEGEQVPLVCRNRNLQHCFRPLKETQLLRFRIVARCYQIAPPCHRQSSGRIRIHHDKHPASTARIEMEREIPVPHFRYGKYRHDPREQHRESCRRILARSP